MCLCVYVFLTVCVSLCVCQRQDGLAQRFISEVNTTSRACVLWNLDEDTDYIIQVQSIGMHGESQASKRIHFRTLEKSDHFQSSLMDQGTTGIKNPSEMPGRLVLLGSYSTCSACQSS